MKLPSGEIATIFDQQITSLHKPTQAICRAVVGDGSFMMSCIPDRDERIAHYLAEKLGGTVTHAHPTIRSTGGPEAVY